MIKCLFFDRDGVVNKRIVGAYVTKPEEFELNIDILPLIRFCDEYDILKIIVTNQQGIGKNIMTIEDLSNVHNYMNQLLLIHSLKNFDDIYFASELHSENLIRRKPSPAMIIEAMKKFELNIADCAMIGDSKTDIQAARNAGIKSIYYHDELYELANLTSLDVNEIIEFIKKL
jgi:D-glycero-D-manno-heptose 1,7-bisphosphate phosphatase